MRLQARSMCISLLATLFCSAPAFAHRADRRDDLRQIAIVEGEWRKAQLAGDASSMDRLLSDDCMGVTAGGKVVTKAQQLERMRTRSTTLSKLSILDEKIKVSGGTAVVTSVADIEGNSAGQPVRGRFRYVRIYRRSPAGVWHIASFEASALEKPQHRLLLAGRF